ncbi:putative NnrU protein [Vibrio nigripulchritudo MADA3029]|uniref:NnrU family protein n=1 Tax=Vibrio nigripulchritudo TaxID=28173 RepID=UPI0003B24260|nr:NnrU family protein [Vibrio nigripulchritudo]CCN48554.1 putative NnrU protein [Vibrio nigripulchritudo MADA3020]CCN55578.1 putative NnrU protein [Vibrio nigripulchritudo MADA3021]CCN60761.1 putative NnrU protein [Vibrio nigripulchritudo MADA3029]
MLLMILGLLMWSAIHFVPTLAPQLKRNMINQVGENGYKGIFSLLVVAGLLMIIFGWRSTIPNYLYVLGPEFRGLTMLLMLVGFILFGAAQGKTRIKRYIRHPQLMSVIVWAVAHLISNGEQRSVLLFGGLALWAVIEIIVINRRDEEWVKPDIPPVSQELKTHIISLVLYLITAFFLHVYLSGIPLR